MTHSVRRRWLQRALVAFGIIFMLVYPIGLIWPAGWVWHGGQGQYYLQMIAGVYAVLGLFLILAARRPEENRSLIWFAVWSSLVHGGIMLVQAAYDHHEHGHLIGDVPALFLVALVLGTLAGAVTPDRAT